MVSGSFLFLFSNDLATCFFPSSRLAACFSASEMNVSIFFLCDRIILRISFWGLEILVERNDENSGGISPLRNRSLFFGSSVLKNSITAFLYLHVRKKISLTAVNLEHRASMEKKVRPCGVEQYGQWYNTVLLGCSYPGMYIMP